MFSVSAVSPYTRIDETKTFIIQNNGETFNVDVVDNTTKILGTYLNIPNQLDLENIQIKQLSGYDIHKNSTRDSEYIQVCYKITVDSGNISENTKSIRLGQSFGIGTADVPSDFHYVEKLSINLALFHDNDLIYNLSENILSPGPGAGKGFSRYAIYGLGLKINTSGTYRTALIDSVSSNDRDYSTKLSNHTLSPGHYYFIGIWNVSHWIHYFSYDLNQTYQGATHPGFAVHKIGYYAVQTRGYTLFDLRLPLNISNVVILAVIVYLIASKEK